ncbi:MAG: formylmethanofuran dehydrogenase [ANME-2 cluster archaeon]|nr:formylmethanofuran dehydrogenase [ANME-2 cluster archaeon]
MPVDVGKFIKAPDYDIKVITYRDVFQAVACEEDYTGDECREMSAVIVLDAAEMKRMGFHEGKNVRLTSKWGSVVVMIKKSPREEQKGLGFMVNSPWSNALVSDEMLNGIPEFKDIEVKITGSNDEITSIKELFML